MKKSLVSILLTAGMVLSLTACGSKPEETKAPDTTAAKAETTAAKTETTAAASEEKKAAEEEKKDTEAKAETTKSAGTELYVTFFVGFDLDFPPL